MNGADEASVTRPHTNHEGSSMTRKILRACVLLSLASAVLATDVLATCGGGGGGGTGGMANGTMGSPAEVYPVPWKPVAPGDAVDPHGLVVYWFPASQIEMERSSLLNSRALALYASECVTYGVSDSTAPIGRKYVAGGKLPVAVLADAGGKEIARLVTKDGKLYVDDVEKMVSTEIKSRETAVRNTMKAAKDKEKIDKDAAIALYRGVVEQKCMFPGPAKDAQSALKKLGVAGGAPIPAAAGPAFDRAKGARVEQALKDGLMAENMAKYGDAEKLYARAHAIDPADPAPLRYLGELYRHETGDWDKARRIFQQLLDMPADPISRAVALHGLGKMTVHAGEFQQGLALMEQSAAVYPLALTYRNLAVYWHSEGDLVKSDEYTRKALALDPKDPFNLIFAAAFMAGNGQAEEALKVAEANESLLCASYNLAAIYAQAGDTRKALDLLRRHFFEYERTQSVRSKEMMEARVDIVFASLAKNAEFLEMTAGADGKLPMRGR